MADRAELVEAALEVFPEGLALVDRNERVVFWNRAAELLTGHPGAQLVGRALPGPLEELLGARCDERADTRRGPDPDGGLLVHVRHMRGHDVPAPARRMALRDGLGTRIGTAVAFHAAERLEACRMDRPAKGPKYAPTRPRCATGWRRRITRLSM
jgi:PAS domain S-box-containing protein